LRVALVVPHWGKEYVRARDTRGIAGCWPTPGLQYVAAMLRDAGHSLLYLEGYFYTTEEMLRRVDEFRADAVGIYVISILWDNAKPFLEGVKALRPGIFTFAGGHGATGMPERLLAESPWLDACVVGEGEYTATEMLGALACGKPLEGVDGLVYREAVGRIVATKPRPMIEDLDALPFPAVELSEMERYFPSFEQVHNVPVVQMLASRGCTGGCLYCYKMYGRRIRLRDPKRVVDEMEYYVKRYGAREIKFWDEHFAHSHEHAYAICEEIRRRGLRVRWWCSCRADSVDPKILKAMARAGCWCINFGVESGVQKNLDTLLKREKVERIEHAVRMAHAAGIKTHSTYIFGIPGETYDEGLRTIELATRLNSFTVEFFPITPFPGTPLQKGVEKGLFGKMSDSLADQGMLLEKPCFVPFSMTADEMMKLRRLSYVRYFIRPWFLLYRFTNIMSPFQLRAIFYGAASLLQMWGEQIASEWKKLRGRRSA
jgi:anaerobic magnesium-protoporphyrin IX monomethyl ester cyclase